MLDPCTTCTGHTNTLINSTSNRPVRPIVDGDCARPCDGSETDDGGRADRRRSPVRGSLERCVGRRHAVAREVRGTKRRRDRPGLAECGGDHDGCTVTGRPWGRAPVPGCSGYRDPVLPRERGVRCRGARAIRGRESGRPVVVGRAGGEDARTSIRTCSVTHPLFEGNSR